MLPKLAIRFLLTVQTRLAPLLQLTQRPHEISVWKRILTSTTMCLGTIIFGVRPAQHSHHSWAAIHQQLKSRLLDVTDRAEPPTEDLGTGSGTSTESAGEGGGGGGREERKVWASMC